jgi:oligopeptidase B
MTNRYVITLLAVATVAGCEQAYDRAEPIAMSPPAATIVPTELSNHGVTRVDNYYWLNDRENPDVIAYLNAENEYTDAVTAHTRKPE